MSHNNTDQITNQENQSEQINEVVVQPKPDHPLVTRRDFLAQGVMGFGATIALPGMLGLSFRKVWAAECGGTVEGSNFLPFMVFDMAGGGGLPANFLVGKRGGAEDLLASYDLLGWNPRESGALNSDFGLPMSAKYSKILEGILATSSPAARANTRMGSFCHFAQDDSTSNRLNAGSLVLKSGNRGAFISNGMGLIDSNSGGNSQSVVGSAVFKPNFVRSVTDVLGAVTFGGNSFAGLSLDQKKTMVSGGIAMSRLQKMDYLGLPGGETLADLSQCAYEKSADFLQNVAGLDPRGDAQAQAVYQINANSAPGDANAVAAAVAMNVLKGQSGPSTWTLGGCDYHDGTQTSGDGKDREIGVQIGRALELAHRLQKPFFFQILTDGGVDAERGTRKWRGDSGDKCMTVIGYYDPKGAPKMKRIQVGHYSDGQGAETSTMIGNDPALVGYAVLANYLNISGKLTDFSTLAPGVFPGQGQLESVLIFEPMV